MSAGEPRSTCEHTPARGRKRDATRDDALRRAAIDLLAEVGYERLTIDAVAARASAGKATVYRRWENKAELVVDALAQRQMSLSVPETGTLRGDFEAYIEGRENAETQDFRTRLLSGLVAAVVQSPELRVALQRARGTDPVQLIIERAIVRGEIEAPPNPELIAALFPAMSLYRFVLSGESYDPEFTRALLDNVVMPLVTGEPVRAGAGR